MRRLTGWLLIVAVTFVEILRPRSRDVSGRPDLSRYRVRKGWTPLSDRRTYNR